MKATDRKQISKKAVAPVIATILLIAIAVILAGVIFIWAKGFIGEKIQKEGSAIELACDEIADNGAIEAEYVSGSLNIVNKGNIPVYGVDIKAVGAGERRTFRIFEGEGSGLTIATGETASVKLSDEEISGATELFVVPIILGEKGTNKVAYTCGESTGISVQV